MKWRLPALAIVIAVALTATGIGLAIIAGQRANPAPTKTGKTTSIAMFLDSMRTANMTHFVLTYRLNGYSFLSYGTIVIAQMPSPPGTRFTTNEYGYSGAGRYAYVFHGPTGRIVQWIKNGTNASACVNVLMTGNLATGTFGKLECLRPSPIIPSNGFAEEDVGFVTTYVLQSVTGLGGPPGPAQEKITTKVSQQYGSLRCLTQLSGTTTQTTCINQAGFIVSWLLQNGMGSFSRAILISLNHHPIAGDFKTLIRPTKSFILPPV